MTPKSKCQCGHIQERHYVGDKSCFDCDCGRFTSPATLLTDEKEIDMENEILLKIKGSIAKWFCDETPEMQDFIAKEIYRKVYPLAFAAGEKAQRERDTKEFLFAFDNEKHEQALSEARKQGAREVVEWFMHLHNPSARIGDGGHNYWAHEEELQSKLKELEG